MKLLSDAVDFLLERFPLEKMNYQCLVEKKEVPLHSMTWGYYTGGLTLFFFSIQVVTGLFLLYYYHPDVSGANLSVEYISNHVKNGQLIRNMHTWSSSDMIFFALCHLLVTFSMKAFVKPRELTWIAGVLLLFITMTFGFTGYLLPWNQIAVNATKVGLQSAEAAGQLLPGPLSKIPTIICETFQGGHTVCDTTLSRFYALHVVVLPLLLVSFLGLHLLLVQLHGMSQGVDQAARRSEKFVPVSVLRDLMIWAIAFLVLFVLALCIPFDSFLPFPLLEPFNALGATPVGIKPEWYFYFVYYPFELLPFVLVVLLSTLIGAVAFATPWLLKNTSRRNLRLMALTAASYLFVITVLGSRIYSIFRH